MLIKHVYQQNYFLWRKPLWSSWALCALVSTPAKCDDIRTKLTKQGDGAESGKTSWGPICWHNHHHDHCPFAHGNVWAWNRNALLPPILTPLHPYMPGLWSLAAHLTTKHRGHLPVTPISLRMLPFPCRLKLRILPAGAEKLKVWELPQKTFYPFSLLHCLPQHPVSRGLWCYQVPSLWASLSHELG